MCGTRAPLSGSESGGEQGVPRTGEGGEQREVPPVVAVSGGQGSEEDEEACVADFAELSRRQGTNTGPHSGGVCLQVAQVLPLQVGGWVPQKTVECSKSETAGCIFSPMMKVNPVACYGTNVEPISGGVRLQELPVLLFTRVESHLNRESSAGECHSPSGTTGSVSMELLKAPWKVFCIWVCRCVCNSTACGLHLSLPQSLPSSPLPAPILPAHLPTLLPLSSRREPEEGDDPSQGRDVFNERPPAEELLALAEVAKQSTSALPENVVSRDSLLLGGTLAKWSPIRCEGMVHASASGNHLPRQAGRITLVSCPHARLP